MPFRSLFIALISVAAIALTVREPSKQTGAAAQVLPDARLLTALGRSHLSLVTDFVWMKTASQAVRLSSPADGLELMRWCGLVADLDPRFPFSYVVGGILGVVDINGVSTNVAPARALLARGVEARPDRFDLPLYLAFNDLSLSKNPRSAGAVLARASREPGAPEYFAPLSARLLSAAGSPEEASRLALELAGQTTDPEQRAVLEHRANEARREVVRAQIAEAVARFREARLRLPNTIEELVTTGFLTTPPVDPAGGTFSLAPDGSVISSSGDLEVFIPLGG